MLELTFNAPFGDEIKTVVLSNPHGAQGNSHLMIDNYYCGTLLRTAAGYRIEFNYKYTFTAADSDILLQLVKDWELKNPTFLQGCRVTRTQ